VEKIPETEPAVIVRIADQRPTLASQFSQQGQTLSDKRFADARLLAFRQDGNRPQAIPVFCTVGNDDR
jgi:hypothetical protein